MKIKQSSDQQSVEDVKDWLMRYRNNERDLDNQNERLDRLVTKMTSVGAQTLSDMPRLSSSAGDRIGDYIAKKEELEDNISSTVANQQQQRKIIEEILTHLNSPDERAVIRSRYLDVASWSDVTDLMFGGREDYVGKEETYLRRVHKVHGSALLHMARYITGEKNSI